MEMQSIAKTGMTPLQGIDQTEVIHLPEQVSNPEELNIQAVTLIRWLSIFFCLVFWYGVYKLLTFVIA